MHAAGQRQIFNCRDLGVEGIIEQHAQRFQQEQGIAAGLSLEAERLSEFRHKLSKTVEKMLGESQLEEASLEDANMEGADLSTADLDRLIGVMRSQARSEACEEMDLSGIGEVDDQLAWLNAEMLNGIDTIFKCLQQFQKRYLLHKPSQLLHGQWLVFYNNAINYH